LAEGLQNALHASGGSPKQHRTDSLSAAYRNLGGKRQKPLTQLYDALCDHYRMEPTRNNRGVTHENGAIESPHGHLKNRIEQAIYLRGSADFPSVEAYQAVVAAAAEGLNRQHADKFAAERAALQPLPKYRVPDYEILTARVSRHSTIEVRCILYTVPSRLIGQRVELHLYHDRILGFWGQTQVFALTRMRVQGNGKRRGRCIDYRHVIEGLRRKPRALLYCTWQKELLPNERYRQLWNQLKTDYERDRAARLMVEALYQAATHGEDRVADYLERELAAGSLTPQRLQVQFQSQHLASVPALQVEQHSLHSYDQLLSSGGNAADPDPVPEPDGAAQADAP
ncbi:integrase core domain protein, partial [Rubidibacter lacunae KORDI 51-2]